MKLKKRLKRSNWKKYIFEFLSVFFAVTFAFLLDSWNDNRKESLAEKKILEEIYKGLERDSLDLKSDEAYYKIAFKGIDYFNNILDGSTVKSDSLVAFYYLFSRDVLVVQNKSGYESLKSRGLGIIKNDSLRNKIINLYEVNYELNRKFNEEYDENKFLKNYFHSINNVLAPNFIFGPKGNIQDIELPIKVDEKKRKILKSYLWKIKMGKSDRYSSSQSGQKKIGELRKAIKIYLNSK